MSDCSPTDFNLREGSRDKIRTMGVLVFSWRMRDNDEVRKCSKDDSRSGRKGIYAERKRSPFVTDGRFK